MDGATGRQSGGWTNKLIWGDNKLVLSSLKNGPLRREIEKAGGLKLVYIDPPFDVGADFSFDIEVGELDILFGKIKTFIQERLFEKSIDLEELNILRNLSEIAATRTILETFKKVINDLTVVDRGTSQVRDRIKMSQSRPYAVKQQGYVLAKKSIFNKIVGDSHFELEFASFLDGCKDIVSFVKNDRQMNPSLFIEYQNADGSISNYFPDFLVKRSAKEIWIVETKGREDLDDPRKWERLKSWVADATARTEGTVYKAMFAREEEWDKRPLHDFGQAISAFDE
jgi:type III restriction enzyme